MKKRMLLAHKEDESRVGLPLATVREECPPPELRLPLFETDEPVILWRRVRAFQVHPLRLIAEQAMPRYKVGVSL